MPPYIFHLFLIISFSLHFNKTNIYLNTFFAGLFKTSDFMIIFLVEAITPKFFNQWKWALRWQSNKSWIISKLEFTLVLFCRIRNFHLICLIPNTFFTSTCSRKIFILGLLGMNFPLLNNLRLNMPLLISWFPVFIIHNDHKFNITTYTVTYF